MFAIVYMASVNGSVCIDEEPLHCVIVIATTVRLVLAQHTRTQSCKEIT